MVKRLPVAAIKRTRAVNGMNRKAGIGTGRVVSTVAGVTFITGKSAYQSYCE
jgi:hypothetical protein